LFNEESGRKYLSKLGVDKNTIDKLPYLGISSICNLLSSIKMAKYYDFNENDIIFTIFTDSVELYYSRLKEMNQNWGKYSESQAEIDWNSVIKKQGTDNFIELTYNDQKRIHNLKYFTWVEQQGKDVEELNAQWYDENYWNERFAVVSQWDKLIDNFNREVGISL
jgi:cysteine synthase A